MGRRVALITGITGQDGSYLAELLLEKDYKVYGLLRRTSAPNFRNVAHIKSEIEFVQGDLLDQSGLTRIFQLTQPDEVYNLAAQSHVGESFNQPDLTSKVTGFSVLNILEAARSVCPDARIYQASTSELFGNTPHSPQNERTPFYPRSPYGVAKLYAHWLTINYRESYHLFACCGILFNHESERRAEEFVTRKITKGLAEIKKGKRSKLLLGSLHPKRDWGHARDYVRAMWLMLQQDTPQEYVIGTGETHSVQEFVLEAIHWTFPEVENTALASHELVQVDARFVRPAEVNLLFADASRARKELGWEPKIRFTELVRLMVQHDLADS